jgi:type IV secretory pathway TrbD component
VLPEKGGSDIYNMRYREYMEVIVVEPWVSGVVGVVLWLVALSVFVAYWVTA